ncbi:extracellular solute-binding protein [Thermaerobacter sp. PB12/4term]|uniref:extracellular solute-binding protein n=1 Tax=Thermaerobacter sp. PB12/4term TaxID=2293838 RepID=UPI000E32B78D|nr:extracellular solute-binding protein [Thermaerobacter sp. PB12/4term]QIA27836.1 extracellular solute-binding protein [Thermaerobacter sp. PB12/4term]
MPPRTNRRQTPGGPPAGRQRWQRLALVIGVAALLVVAAGALALWRQRQGDPWARYRPVPLDPGKTYEIVLWETEMPVAVLPDPLRLPGGPSPEPRAPGAAGPGGGFSAAGGPGTGSAEPVPAQPPAGQNPAGAAGSPGPSGAAGQPGPTAPPGAGESGSSPSSEAGLGAGAEPGRRGGPPPVPPLAEPGPFTHREYLQQALAAFARQFPNIRVRVEWIPASEAQDRLQRALADGKPPDVFGGWGSALLVRHPLQVPLDPYLSRAERRWYNPTALLLYQADRRSWVWPRWVAPHTWWVAAARLRAAGLDPNALLLAGWTYADVDRLAGLAGPPSAGDSGAAGAGEAPAGRAQGSQPPASQPPEPPSPGDRPVLTLWAARPDLPLEQLLRVRGLAAPLAPSGAVIWAGPEGRAALAWLERLRSQQRLHAVAGDGVAEWLAEGDLAGPAGGFTPALARWLLERYAGLVPRQPEEPAPRPGVVAVPPLVADRGSGTSAVPERWPVPPAPRVDAGGRLVGGIPDPADPRRLDPLVPPGFDGLVLLPPPVPAGAPRPALLETGGLMVFRQNRYRGDDHTQAAVELARFLSRWRTDVLTRRLLAVPADVTSLAAWRATSPLPAVYRQQLEHLALGVWNQNARGRWQRMAVTYPTAPGAPGPEHRDVARQVRPPLAAFWAGKAGASQVIQSWGGAAAPQGDGSGEDDRGEPGEPPSRR